MNSTTPPTEIPPTGVRYREYLMRPISRTSYPCLDPVIRRDADRPHPIVGAVAWRWMGEVEWRKL